jgi:hypothetical protein
MQTAYRSPNVRGRSRLNATPPRLRARTGATLPPEQRYALIKLGLPSIVKTGARSLVLFATGGNYSGTRFD